MFAKMRTWAFRGVSALAVMASFGSAAMAQDLSSNAITANPDGKIAVLDVAGGDQVLSRDNGLKIKNDLIRFDPATGDLIVSINSGTRGLGSIVAALKAVSIETSVEAIATENGIKDPGVIQVTDYKIPYTIAPAIVANAVAAAQTQPAQTLAVAPTLAPDSSIIPNYRTKAAAADLANYLQSNPTTSASFNPLLFAINVPNVQTTAMGPVILAQAASTTTPPAPAATATVPAPAVTAPAPALATVVASAPVVSTGILSDAQLAALTHVQIEERLKQRFPDYDAGRLDKMALGYSIAAKLALSINGKDADGNVQDYDGLMDILTPDLIKAELNAALDLTDAELNQAVHGYQMGAMDAIANDKPCDTLDENYFTDGYEQVLSAQPDLTAVLVGKAAFDGYQAGIEKVEECGDDCKVEEAVVAPVAPEPVVEKTIPVVNGSLCNTINAQAEGAQHDFMDVVGLNPDHIYRVGNDILLRNSEPLDVTGLSIVPGQLSKEYMALCTGSGPIEPPKPRTVGGGTYVPNGGGVTNIPTTIVPQRCEQRLRSDGNISLRGNFAECCFGQNYQTTNAQGLIIKLMGSTTTGVCARPEGGETPTSPPVIDNPDNTGGCTTGCTGGDTGNGDITPDTGVGGGNIPGADGASGAGTPDAGAGSITDVDGSGSHNEHGADGTNDAGASDAEADGNNGDLGMNEIPSAKRTAAPAPAFA